MKIYISIPMTGHSLETQKEKAVSIAAKLREMGHEPVNPFDTPLASDEWDDKRKYAYYMGEDIKQLLMCDAIYLCKGWAKSRGCNIEYQVALQMGMNVYQSLE